MVNFDDMHRRCASLIAAAERATDAESRQNLRQQLMLLQADIAALRNAERGNGVRNPFREVLFDLFVNSLHENRIHGGVIAEIGGAKNSFLGELPGYDVRYLSLLPSPDPRVTVADITNCPHVPDASFDAILSLSVLEHVTHIQEAGREITRLLKPGGVTMHAVPFSYFFHGAPVDYWRVTTTALNAIFEELEPIDCFFYSDNRRRNNLGSPANPIDRDGGPLFAADAFGGWRENWFTVYIGRRLPDGAARLQRRREHQVLVDLMKNCIEQGLSEAEAGERALRLSRHVSFDRHGRLQVSREPNGAPALDAAGLAEVWNKRGRKTVRPSVARHNLLAMLGAAGLG